MQNLGYYNGSVQPLTELKIPATDRAIYFGDGAYEVVFAVNKKPFAIDEHIERFFSSCELLNINFNKTKTELKNLILDLMNQETSYHQKIYWQVSRGSGFRQHVFNNESKPNLLITITQDTVQNMEKTKFDLISVEDTRFLHCNIKTLNLLPAIMASQKAKEMKAQEAVLHRNGFVTECAHSNISIIKDHKLKTAPENNLILAGITRKHLIEICNQLQIEVNTNPFTLDELYNCDEAIVSASGTLFMAAKSLNGKAIGGKDTATLNKLQNAYKNKIINECGTLLYD